MFEKEGDYHGLNKYFRDDGARSPDDSPDEPQDDNLRWRPIWQPKKTIQNDKPNIPIQIDDTK